jgi:UDP-MurNAc hydroxylase
MKFTVLGHACLLIEHGDTRLLVDPWLLGSCYWRSWWNYPEIDPKIIDEICPSHIYISHLHWDHFHGPTLRRFYKDDPHIIIPYAPTRRIISDIKRDFKFSKVTELTHGSSYQLLPDFTLFSYHFNPFFIDSSLVVECDGYTIFNANDSKVFGLSLRHILSNHASVDFVFRSHSSASPIPYCVNGVNPNNTSRSPYNYSRDFLAFANACRAKYCVPFASSHVYLHRDVLEFNKFYNSPSKLYQFVQSTSSDCKCIVMPSMSSWDSLSGFSISPHVYSSIESDIEDMSNKHSASLIRHYDKEISVRLKKSAFEKYFTSFCNSVHWPMRQFRFAFFAVPSLNSDYGALCVVDIAQNHISFFDELNFSERLLSSYSLSFVVKVPVLVLNDCVSKFMFNSFTPSKLLRIYDPDCTNLYSSLFSFLDLFENDSLPLSRILERRQLLSRLPRWREAIDAFYYFVLIEILKRPLHSIWSTSRSFV